MTFLFIFQQWRPYWIIRDYWRRGRFKTNQFFFTQRERRQAFWSAISIGRELVRIILPSLFIALIPLLALETAEHELLRESALSAIPYVRGLIEFIGILRVKAIENANSVAAFLSILASVSGIFLGLYFTAISVVASSAYTHAPSTLRELLLKEKVGNLYIRSLSILMASALLMLCASVFGYHAGALPLLYIIALGCFGVFCFGELGIRAFYFFDPTRLCDSIYYELAKNIRSATIDGFRWNSPDFQAHYNKLATQSVSKIDALVKFCLQEKNLMPAALIAVLHRSSIILAAYFDQRIGIPTNSQWYGRAPKHKSWFLQDHTRLNLALKTNTPIPPEVVPTPDWLEMRIAHIHAFAIKQLLDSHNTEAVHHILNPTNELIQKMSSLLDVKRSIDYTTCLGEPIDQYFRRLDKGKQFTDESALALFDMRGFNLLSLAMGFFQFLREFNVEKVAHRLHSVNWASSSDIYKNGLSPALLERLEFLRARLQFELDVEGNIVSPRWYITQLLLMNYLVLLHSGLEHIFTLIEAHFVAECDALLKNNLHALVVSRAYRGLEICWKFERHLPTFKNIVDDLNKRLVNTELKTPKWDFLLIETRMGQIRDSLYQRLAACLLPLASVTIKDTLPDLFGQTYATTCNYCYDCMLKNQPDAFSATFPAVFFGALHAHDKLMTMLHDWKPETALGLSADPLLDIMELSGYALIYSALHAKPDFQAICIKCWDDFLRKKSDPKAALSVFVGFYEFRKSQFQSSPRDILRSEWRIQLNQKLVTMEIVDERYGMTYGAKKKPATHSSPLIRALCRNRMEPHISAAEVFIVAHLLRRSEAGQIDFKSRWGFADHFNKEMAQEHSEGGNE